MTCNTFTGQISFLQLQKVFEDETRQLLLPTSFRLCNRVDAREKNFCAGNRAEDESSKDKQKWRLPIRSQNFPVIHDIRVSAKVRSDQELSMSSFAEIYCSSVVKSKENAERRCVRTPEEAKVWRINCDCA